MRALLIYNPGAGDGDNGGAGHIEALMREAGLRVQRQSTDATDWSRALQDPGDMVVVAGGDGTVGRVARRMVGSGVPIAVLPLGTANNISRTLGITEQTVPRLIAGWRSARRVPFDVGIATGPFGERCFIEGLGAGLLSCCMPRVDESETTEQLPDAEVKVTYAQQILREELARCPPIDVRATLDGADISGRYLLFEALIMQFVGPNLFLAPHIARSDGRMDVVMVREQDRDEAAEHIRTWQDGNPWPPEFTTRRGRRLVLQWSGYPLHIDDLLWPQQGGERQPCPAEIKAGVIAGGVEFLVPREIEEKRTAPAAGAGGQGAAAPRS